MGYSEAEFTLLSPEEIKAKNLVDTSQKIEPSDSSLSIEVDDHELNINYGT